ncbi:hypothetical protein SELMODRAFT_432035 [Selaginella moellendorffii]|uniref:Uncharacterized protein n=1 Tax=Selaginella moellendorffii TaxID=88036 RepID=D8TES2_SELML|nr:hypothetical protein SELMODRAFT_432035 [Selaginella moellendorffii]
MQSMLGDLQAWCSSDHIPQQYSEAVREGDIRWVVQRDQEDPGAVHVDVVLPFEWKFGGWKRVTDYESGSEEAKEIMQRVNAAEMAFEWFGGNQGAHLHALKHAPGGAQVETCVRVIQQTMVLRRIKMPILANARIHGTGFDRSCSS